MGRDNGFRSGEPSLSVEMPLVGVTGGLSGGQFSCEGDLSRCENFSWEHGTACLAGDLDSWKGVASRVDTEK